MYPLSANSNVLSTTSRFCFPPQCYVNINVMLAWYQLGGQEVAESTLALAESGYVDLP
jgi:hypothetical protein